MTYLYSQILIHYVINVLFNSSCYHLTFVKIHNQDKKVGNNLYFTKWQLKVGEPNNE